MKVHEAQEGIELIYPEDGGELILCPVCESVWMEDDEHRTPCEHLRFVYCTLGDRDFVFFTKNCDDKSFRKSFDAFRDENEYVDEMVAFKGIDHPDVEVVVYSEWGGYGMEPSFATYWGYSSTL